MDIGIISVRYARALLRYAEENKEEDSVYKEMVALSERFVCLPQLQAVLHNPVLTGGQIADMLIAACGDEESLTNSTRRFIHLVTQRKRAGFMMFIANSYVTLYRKSKHLIKGRLVLPHAISEAVSQRLRTLVEEQTASKVDFKIDIDRSMGGGFILEYDTYRLDASLRTQIEQIHRALKC